VDNDKKGSCHPNHESLGGTTIIDSRRPQKFWSGVDKVSENFGLEGDKCHQWDPYGGGQCMYKTSSEVGGGDKVRKKSRLVRDTVRTFARSKESLVHH